MSRHLASGLVAVALVTLAIAGAWAAISMPSARPEEITIGVPPGDSAALLYVAADRGFFAGNGLNVTLRYYNVSSQAVTGMERGEADLAHSPEFSVVADVLEGRNISAIACIDRVQGYYIVARRDRGITTIPDLAGKTVGLPRSSAAEFYLGRSLDLRGSSIGNVALVDTPSPQAAVDLIVNGSVDAVVTSQRYAATIEKALGDTVVVLPAQSDQPAYVVLSGRADWVAGHTKTIERLLAALDRAEQYTVANPADAKAIVKDRMGYDDAYVEQMWPGHQFGLSLDQSLLIAMNDEARWAVANNLTKATSIPDLGETISMQGLRHVHPAAVKIMQGGTGP